MSSSVDFLRLPGPAARVEGCGSRARSCTARASRTGSGSSRRRSRRGSRAGPGASTFQRFWLPLLRAKLGESWREANAAFIWATIQRLYAARRSGLKKEMFGYVPGGYARVLERFATVLARPGRRRSGARRRWRGSSAADGGASQVVLDGAASASRSTTSSSPATRRPRPGCARTSTTPSGRGSTGISYQGIVCASLVLRSSLSGYYLTYLFDDLPFTAVVEMTRARRPRPARRHALVFLPKYVAPDDPLFEVPDDEIEARFLAGLRTVHPGVERADVLGVRISRVRRVFPIPTLGYSERVPADRHERARAPPRELGADRQRHAQRQRDGRARRARGPGARRHRREYDRAAGG